MKSMPAPQQEHLHTSAGYASCPAGSPSTVPGPGWWSPSRAPAASASAWPARCPRRACRSWSASSRPARPGSPAPSPTRSTHLAVVTALRLDADRLPHPACRRHPGLLSRSCPAGSVAWALAVSGSLGRSAHVRCARPGTVRARSRSSALSHWAGSPGSARAAGRAAGGAVRRRARAALLPALRRRRRGFDPQDHTEVDPRLGSGRRSWPAGPRTSMSRPSTSTWPPAARSCAGRRRDHRQGGPARSSGNAGRRSPPLNLRDAPGAAGLGRRQLGGGRVGRR
jgi:hypothetical protein